MTDGLDKFFNTEFNRLADAGLLRNMRAVKRSGGKIIFPAGRENGRLHIENSPLHLPQAQNNIDLPPTFTLGVRPEDIQPNENGQFPGRVALIEPLGVETVLHIQVGEQTLISLVSGMSRLDIGDEVMFDIAQDRLHFFDHDGFRVDVVKDDQS